MENIKSTTESSDNSNIGAIYSLDDHIGLWFRILIMIIDGLALFIYGVLVFLLFLMFQLPDNYFLFPVFIGAFLYLTILKASETGTIAYIMLKIKVVGLNGNPPSFIKMIIRFALLIIGPLEFILDMIWLTGESTKQTLRDKVAGTYVLKSDAEPIEFGVVKYVYLDVLGYAFTVKEVQRNKTNI